MKRQVEQRIRRAMQLERERAFARAGNIEDLRALIDGKPPIDAEFQYQVARRDAAKATTAWRKAKRLS